jgi:hypothetical protein
MGKALRERGKAMELANPSKVKCKGINQIAIVVENLESER